VQYIKTETRSFCSCTAAPA